MKKIVPIIMLIIIMFSCKEKSQETFQSENDTNAKKFTPLLENECLYYETFRKEVEGTFNVIFRTDYKGNVIEEIHRHPMLISDNQFLNPLKKKELFFFMGENTDNMELYLCNGNEGTIEEIEDIYRPFSVSFDKKYLLTLDPSKRNQSYRDDYFYVILRDFTTRKIIAEKDIFEYAPKTLEGDDFRFSPIVEITHEDDAFILSYSYEISIFNLSFNPVTQEVKQLYVNEYHPFIVKD